MSIESIGPSRCREIINDLKKETADAVEHRVTKALTEAT